MDEISIYKASLLGNLIVWLVTLISPKPLCLLLCSWYHWKALDG
jgi:hypothetical protein